MRIPLLLLALAALPTPAAAQDRLTLTDAIEKARAANPAARAAQAAEAEAGTRVRQAQGAWLPRVDVTDVAPAKYPPAGNWRSLRWT